MTGVTISLALLALAILLGLAVAWQDSNEEYGLIEPVSIGNEERSKP